MLDHRLCIAPMMDWTDRHERYFLRLITRKALLYTEMVTTGAIIHGDRQRLLGYSTREHPLALQIGGCDPVELSRCAGIAQSAGFLEINLNVGCPSERVQSGRFGACLLSEPGLVAECVSAMRKHCDLPVTVKTRTGVDQQDSYDHLSRFIRTVADAGCATFIIHARKAWLKGLSPRQNREIPPLQYDRVYRLKQEYPHLNFILNGGVNTLDQASHHLNGLDGVMIGRAAYRNPWMLADADRLLFDAVNPVSSRQSVIELLIPYIETQISHGVALKHITRHILGLYQGCPGARAWRRHLSQNAHKPGAGISVLRQALAMVKETHDEKRHAA